MRKTPLHKIQYINENYHLSTDELAKRLSLAKSTVSRYLREARAKYETDAERTAREARWRQKAHECQMASIEVTTQQKALEIFETHRADIFFQLGLALYWAEGKKGASFDFGNSDPAMIDQMTEWLHRYIPNSGITLSIDVPSHQTEEFCRAYWTEKIDLSRYKKVKFYNSNRRIRIDGGVCRINVNCGWTGASKIMDALLELHKTHVLGLMSIQE